ncbi:MAG: tetratricopeptide repeat protein, partial [Verrucomicrobiota bacterium]|nr:tetratricopeptide repeat protein [Verrucomicrobiota bacterium]
HKGKILLYALLLGVALVSFAAYQILTQRKLAAAADMLTQASNEEDYRRIIQKFPRTTAAADAQLLLAAQLRAEKKYDESNAILKSLLDQTPDHPLASGALLSMAANYEAQGKTSEAIEAYQQISSRFAGSYSAPVAAINRADLLKASGKAEEAKRAYENVLTQFPQSLVARDASRELKNLK